MLILMFMHRMFNTVCHHWMMQQTQHVDVKGIPKAATIHRTKNSLHIGGHMGTGNIKIQISLLWGQMIFTTCIIIILVEHLLVALSTVPAKPFVLINDRCQWTKNIHSYGRYKTKAQIKYTRYAHVELNDRMYSFEHFPHVWILKSIGWRS